MDKKAPLKAIIEDLFSIDSSVVLKQLNQIETSGQSSYIPYLIEVRLNSDDLEVQKKVESILSQLKHKDSVPEMIAALRNEKYASIKMNLLSCCWQNGLDYADDLTLFIDIIAQDDYLTAFEACTVIENLPNKILKEEAELAMEKIQSLKANISEDKLNFLESCEEFIQGNILE